MSKPRRMKRPIHGWLVLDKPLEITSNQALGVVKRALQPAKAGHAGTLDPLATGLLPIALGEATKTVNAVMDGRKVYRFTVRWGVETTTDDTEGEVVETRAHRPDPANIQTALPRFTGAIEQVPPAFSAIKVDGERAYDLARDGEKVELKSRTVLIDRLSLLESPNQDTTVFEVECGKGTYVRSIARDLGRELGCLGHVTELRRLRVGPFGEADMVPLSAFQASNEAGQSPNWQDLVQHVRRIQDALGDMPRVTVGQQDVVTLKRGHTVLLRGRSAPVEASQAYAVCGDQLLALGVVERGHFVPKRVFNL